MCRLFGFRSVLTSQVHSSLLGAENALEVQSSDHPDGWGVAYYLQNIPHVVKSAKSALDDKIFKRVSGVVSSQTVLAHIRKTTVGQLNILNTHPFQFGPWVFAHNGHIVDFENKKDILRDLIDPELRSYILGETDSEYIFYFLLTKIKERYDLSAKHFELDQLIKTIHEGIDELISLVGEASADHNRGTDANYFTFILTNGKTMLGHQRGKKLHFSTHKVRCPERDECSFLNESCENAPKSGPVNHLLLSSEPLSGENVWTELEFGQTVAVDEKMSFTIK
jgi:predicted glutamine amidotransferase